MCVADHKPLFRQSCETNSETRFSLEFVNVGDEQKFPKTSVCIILVDLVYLESANIYTGPKIVRGLKRLRTTGLEPDPCESVHQLDCSLLFPTAIANGTERLHNFLLSDPTNNKHPQRLIVSTVSETQQKHTKSIEPAQLTASRKTSNRYSWARYRQLMIRQAHNVAIYSIFKHASQTPDGDQGFTSMPIGKL